MQRTRGNERRLQVAAALLSLSIFLMIPVLPGVYTGTIPHATNPGAAIAISLAIFFRMLILIWYLSGIRKIKRLGIVRAGRCLLVAILLLMLGAIYLDGAFAYLDKKEILYVSYLMFGSVFCDVLAAALTLTLSFSKSSRWN